MLTFQLRHQVNNSYARSDDNINVRVDHCELAATERFAEHFALTLALSLGRRMIPQGRRDPHLRGDLRRCIAPHHVDHRHTSQR